MSFIETHALELHKEKLSSLNGQIDYCNEALAQDDIEGWEKKEFESVLADAKAEKQIVSAHIEKLEAQAA